MATYMLVGGFNPSEKYESNGMIIPNIWKKKNVPNHQPVYPPNVTIHLDHYPILDAFINVSGAGKVNHWKYGAVGPSGHFYCDSDTTLISFHNAKIDLFVLHHITRNSSNFRGRDLCNYTTT